jgi:hypothetical protein
MSVQADYIVAGSGASGVMAAQTLLEAGARVLMLDVGVQQREENDFAGADFETLRRTDSAQYRLWLGDHFEGLPLGHIGTGSQLTPLRQHIMRRVQELTPLLSDNFFPMESLALGGLGMAWGLGCCTFSDAELRSAGLDAAAMRKAYNIIARRIGIAYTPDDIASYVADGLLDTQPAIRIDANAAAILQRYEKRRQSFHNKGFRLGRPALALLTEDKDGRKATTYNDLDFYTNEGQSGWRPDVTLERLRAQDGFTYRAGVLVTHFEEKENEVVVRGIGTDTKTAVHFTAKKLLLACNVLGTARIVLRSQKQYETKLPLLCNPYAYAPCLQWSRLGKRPDARKTSTAQLALLHDADGSNRDVAMASLYSYSSLLLFRVLQMAPVGLKEARQFLQYLVPAMTIAGIHQPDAPGSGKYVSLQKNDTALTGDVLQAHYAQDAATAKQIKQRNQLFLQALRKLGCTPLKLVAPGNGASIHYAGTLPFARDAHPLRLLPNGRLGETKNVYVADGSGFCALPARGITLSLMANAHLTALNALHE